MCVSLHFTSFSLLATLKNRVKTTQNRHLPPALVYGADPVVVPSERTKSHSNEEAATSCSWVRRPGEEVRRG